MLHYIKGIVTDVLPGIVVVESGGVGFEINMPDGCPAALSLGTGETVTVYTAMLVREDDISLYGFSDRDSLQLFRLLMTVSGVGAKAAMAMLSALPAPQLKKAIVFEDTASITKANGVGKKIAQRVVLELKDKVQSLGGFDASPAAAAPAPKAGSRKEQAVMGLMALGYSRGEALAAMQGIEDENLSAEQYIRLALRAKK